MAALLRRYVSNDNLHSQWARTREPAQQALSSATRAPRPAYGRTQVLPLSSDSALTDFTMGGTVTGVAWSINPYLGCLHACSYCYVPQTMHLERNRWGRYVAPKRNLPAILRRELQTKPERTVYLSTATDPYQAPEREHRITRACLRQLLRHDWPIDVLTRSPLVVRDLDLLTRFSRARVGLSVPTLDDAARRVIEPHAPPIPGRLKALGQLADAGIATYANLAPAYPFTNGATADAFAGALRDARVGWVNESPWRRVSTFLGPLWDRLHKTEWKSFAQFVASPEQQSRLKDQVFQSLKAAGIPVRVGFYNRPYDLAPAREATSQLKLETGSEPIARLVPKESAQEDHAWEEPAVAAPRLRGKVA